ncbi:hypothetical protein FN846DRAFT_282125 [Sphaerosporella brunnea]|uniref:Uncharacterized protein n=1 Tax=Sphaerosporella brunnea TaxID=1250544 RepID=A0A5J5ELZ0_9PEZI|nr:hypothetical protein FN846DRAFT_282125 [Sphaerosporella brunnea]
MAFFKKMTDIMSALTAHLSTLQRLPALSTQAQPALGTTPPPPPPLENPQVQSIRNCWPAVDPVHLEEILEHRFKVENLIPTTSRNVDIEEYQGIIQLLKLLTVYADILYEFAPPGIGIQDALSSAVLKYMHYLLWLHITLLKLLQNILPAFPKRLIRLPRKLLICLSRSTLNVCARHQWEGKRTGNAFSPRCLPSSNSPMYLWCSVLRW